VPNGTNRELRQIMSAALPLFNYTDVDGAPVCPTCGQAILATHAVMRIDDCMIHVWCFQEANHVEEPCEPAP
jgi:hypothetical protein